MELNNIMFYKYMSLVLFVLYVNVSMACPVPHSGSEYDSLIIVEVDNKINEQNEAYMVTIPVLVDPYLFYGFTQDDRALLKSAYLYYRNKVDNTYVTSPIKLYLHDYDYGQMRGNVEISRKPNIEVEIVAVWNRFSSLCTSVGRKLLTNNK